ncbi:hypothetical protein ACLOJK_040890 [Asimina triloba]
MGVRVPSFQRQGGGSEDWACMGIVHVGWELDERGWGGLGLSLDERGFIIEMLETGGLSSIMREEERSLRRWVFGSERAGVTDAAVRKMQWPRREIEEGGRVEGGEGGKARELRARQRPSPSPKSTLLRSYLGYPDLESSLPAAASEVATTISSPTLLSQRRRARQRSQAEAATTISSPTLLSQRRRARQRSQAEAAISSSRPVIPPPRSQPEPQIECPQIDSSLPAAASEVAQPASHHHFVFSSGRPTPSSHALLSHLASGQIQLDPARSSQIRPDPARSNHIQPEISHPLDPIHPSPARARSSLRTCAPAHTLRRDSP